MIKNQTTSHLRPIGGRFLKGTDLLLSIVLCGGCGGEDESSRCDERVTVLSSAESVSALLGESGADLLASVDATVTDTASYANSETVLTQEPMGETSDITISTVYSGGEIREIESIAHYGKEEIDLHCKSRLEMDVTAEVETADGAFLESRPAVLIREEGGDPVLEAEIDPNAAFNGSFHIVSYNDPPSPEKVTGELINRFGENPADNSGSIQFELTFRKGGLVGSTTHTALFW